MLPTVLISYEDIHCLSTFVQLHQISYLLPIFSMPFHHLLAMPLLHQPKKKYSNISPMQCEILGKKVERKLGTSNDFIGECPKFSNIRYSIFRHHFIHEKQMKDLNIRKIMAFVRKTKRYIDDQAKKHDKHKYRLKTDKKT